MTGTNASDYRVGAQGAGRGPDGELQLIHGANSRMRLWQGEQPADSADKTPSTNDYETLGYVVSGQVELTVEGQTLTLNAGDSYRVPSGAEHVYRVTQTLTAVEVLSTP